MVLNTAELKSAVQLRCHPEARRTRFDATLVCASGIFFADGLRLTVPSYDIFEETANCKRGIMRRTGNERASGTRSKYCRHRRRHRGSGHCRPPAEQSDERVWVRRRSRATGRSGDCPACAETTFSTPALGDPDDWNYAPAILFIRTGRRTSSGRESSAAVHPHNGCAAIWGSWLTTMGLGRHGRRARSSAELSAFLRAAERLAVPPLCAP